MGRIEELAQILLRDGYANNEADARQAALDILLAALRRNDPAPTQGPDVEHVETPDLQGDDADIAHAEDGVAG